ncbi:MAG: L,D-transpeptidase [Pseudomonadota bacterium]
MKFFKTATRLVLAGVAAAFIGAVQVPTTASASTDRWYDYAERKWKSGPRRISRSGYRSNKSPIRKRKVRFDKKYSAGTIVIDTSERRLYYVTKRGRALKYGVGVGRDGFQWTGTHRITRKAEWPDWRPPASMIARVKRQTGVKLKSFYKGGPNNPMGARGLYIGSTIYRIHGTNQPWTIGQAMSSGCIRMANDDVSDLYKRVGIGTRVIVRQ